MVFMNLRVVADDLSRAALVKESAYEQGCVIPAHAGIQSIHPPNESLGPHVRGGDERSLVP